AAIENFNVEVFRSTRGKQAQPIHRLPQITDDRHVRGHADHGLESAPVLAEIVFVVALRLNFAVEIDGYRFIGPLNFEGSAIGLPAVGLLTLEAVEDFLAE